MRKNKQNIKWQHFCCVWQAWHRKKLVHSVERRYSRTIYLRIHLFKLANIVYNNNFPIKNIRFLCTNSRFAVPNDGTYLSRITRKLVHRISGFKAKQIIRSGISFSRSPIDYVFLSGPLWCCPSFLPQRSFIAPSFLVREVYHFLLEKFRDLFSKFIGRWDIVSLADFSHSSSRRWQNIRWHYFCRYLVSCYPLSITRWT